MGTCSGLHFMQGAGSHSKFHMLVEVGVLSMFPDLYVELSHTCALYIQNGLRSVFQYERYQFTSILAGTLNSLHLHLSDGKNGIGFHDSIDTYDLFRGKSCMLIFPALSV